MVNACACFEREREKVMMRGGEEDEDVYIKLAEAASGWIILDHAYLKYESYLYCAS